MPKIYPFLISPFILLFSNSYAAYMVKFNLEGSGAALPVNSIIIGDKRIEEPTDEPTLPKQSKTVTFDLFKGLALTDNHPYIRNVTVSKGNNILTYSILADTSLRFSVVESISPEFNTMSATLLSQSCSKTSNGSNCQIIIGNDSNLAFDNNLNDLNYVYQEYENSNQNSVYSIVFNIEN